MNDSDSFKRANSAALRFLTYRARSVAEVRTRLSRRFSADVVEQVIDSLTAQTLLDDSRFANQWRDSRVASRPRSASAIRRELVSKGVDREVAAAAVRDVDDDATAYRAGQKLARQLDQADESTFRRRIWGYLLRRGFTQTVTRRAIERLQEDRFKTDHRPLENVGDS